MKKSMIVTTTNSVDGKEIDTYIGVISDRLIVGAGLFSEFFAGITDIVGGRSGKFETQMHELYNKLMSSLESQAVKLKADAIVGLKIDMDEISGKNTQMFMISGIGTAVKFKTAINSNEDLLAIEDTNDYITSKDIRLFNLIKSSSKALDSIEELSKDANPANYEGQKLKTQLDELLEEVFDLQYSQVDFFMRLTKLIILNIGDNETIDLLLSYGNVVYPNEINDLIIKAIQDIFQNKMATTRSKNNWIYIASKINFSFKEKLALMSVFSSNFWDSYLFPTLVNRVDTYFKSDIPVIAEIVHRLKNVTYIEPEIEEVKKNTMWVCSRCGYSNKISSDRCDKCHRDKHGLTSDFNNDLEKIIFDLQAILDYANIKSNQ